MFRHTIANVRPAARCMLYRGAGVMINAESCLVPPEEVTHSHLDDILRQAGRRVEHKHPIDRS